VVELIAECVRIEAPMGVGCGEGVFPYLRGRGLERGLLGILYMKCCNLVHIIHRFFTSSVIEFALLLYHWACILCKNFCANCFQTVNIDGCLFCFPEKVWNDWHTEMSVEYSWRAAIINADRWARVKPDTHRRRDTTVGRILLTSYDCSAVWLMIACLN